MKFYILISYNKELHHSYIHNKFSSDPSLSIDFPCTAIYISIFSIIFRLDNHVKSYYV